MIQVKEKCFTFEDNKIVIQAEELPIAIPEGFFTTRTDNGIVIREVFKNQKVELLESGALKKEIVYQNVDCEGRYSKEHKFNINGEKESVCGMCKYTLNCLYGSKRRKFKPKTDFYIRKKKTIYNLVNELRGKGYSEKKPKPKGD